jgi:type IV secretory pathway VirB3-like protein
MQLFSWSLGKTKRAYYAWMIGCALVLAFVCYAIFIAIAGLYEAHEPPGGGASFITLAAMIYGLPIFFVGFPIFYLIIAKFKIRHVYVHSFAVAFIVLVVWAVDNVTFYNDPWGSLAIISIIFISWIVYFELMELLKNKLRYRP